MITLKPCPFCGGVPKQPDCYVTLGGLGKWGLVQCKHCGAQSSDIRTCYEPVEYWADDAALEWNTRGGELPD